MLASQDVAQPRAVPHPTAGKQLPPLKIGVASLHKHAADLACAAVVKLTNARLYAGPGKPLVHGDLWFQHGRIIDPAKRFWEAASAGRFACDVEVDVEGRIVAPGFLDIQFNGAWGVDFSDPSITPSDIEAVLLKLPTTGVTSLCPTLVSSNAHTYRAVLQQFAAFDERRRIAHSHWVRRRQGGSGTTGDAALSASADPAPSLPAAPMARNLGLHLEGPFIAPSKKGAHAVQHIKDAGAALVAAAAAGLPVTGGLAEGAGAAAVADNSAGAADGAGSEEEAAALRAACGIYGVSLQASVARFRANAAAERGVSPPGPAEAAPAAAGSVPAQPAASADGASGGIDGLPPLAVPAGFVRIVTLAPEIPHALALTSALARLGVVVSVGHTDSDIRVADAAVVAGACLITHLFNAMSGFHHRDPGVPGLLGRRYGGVAAVKEAEARAKAGRALSLQPRHAPEATLRQHAEEEAAADSVVAAAPTLSAGDASATDATNSLTAAGGSGPAPAPIPGAPSGLQYYHAMARSRQILRDDSYPDATDTQGAAAAAADDDAGGGAAVTATRPGALAQRRADAGPRRVSAGGAAGGDVSQRPFRPPFLATQTSVSAITFCATHPEDAAGSARAGGALSDTPAALSSRLSSRSASASVGLDLSASSSPGAPRPGYSDAAFRAAAPPPAAAGFAGTGKVFSLSTVAGGHLRMRIEAPKLPGLPPAAPQPQPQQLLSGAAPAAKPCAAAAAAAPPMATLPSAAPAAAAAAACELDMVSPFSRVPFTFPVGTDAAADAAAALGAVGLPAGALHMTPQRLVRERLDGQPFYSLIVDGVHVHPYAVTVASSTHPDGLILVTDAMQAMGLPPGRHTLGGLEVDIYHGLEDGHYEGLHAVLAGTDTLAGAVVPLDQCVRNLAAFTRCDVATAIAAVTTHPASLLGLEHVIGTLATGAWADLVILDDGLHVLHTLVAGQLAYSMTAEADGKLEAATL